MRILARLIASQMVILQVWVATHIIKSDGFTKVELENLKVVQNYLKPKDLKLALEIVKENKNNFERIWDEWFS